MQRTDNFGGSGNVSRRGFLKTGLWGLSGVGLADAFSVPSEAAANISRFARGSHFIVDGIDRIPVEVPFRKTPERNMARELPHWKYFEICEVKLRCGQLGYGETMLWYTHHATNDDDVERALGRNAAELMWDDSLGSGLQMALFDAVARTAGVPIHALLGSKQHERTPLSWWNFDMPPEDWAAECQEALRQGYTDFKTKGRPWFDIWKQVEVAAQVVPESFKLDIDFNGTLLDAERAIPILKDLEAYPQVGIYESPIPQSDIAGNQSIRAATRVPLAMHYGSPAPLVALKEDVCDGFVLNGGASRLLREAAVAVMADKPFWLQLVGTGITAAWSLHFGAVSSHARWPAVNCHQLYTHQLLSESIRVRDGFAAVPDTPGLGFEIDRDTIERFRINQLIKRPDPSRLIETLWPDGRRMYFANDGQLTFMFDQVRKTDFPFFERGVTTRLVPNDGSPGWTQLYEQARRGPVFLKKPR